LWKIIVPRTQSSLRHIPPSHILPGLGAVYEKVFGKKGSNRLYFIANGKACQGFCGNAEVASFENGFGLTKIGKA
jgi:hypothetical protein